LPDLKRHQTTIFHGLSNELPFGIHTSDIPSVVTIHDLIFLRYPRYYHPIDRRIYAYKFRRACLEANRIVAVSQQTKEDILAFFGIAEEKIDVVYQGCDESFYQPQTDERKEEVSRKYALTIPYILYVGSIEERKNLLELVKAFDLLGADGLRLVVVGRRTPYAAGVEAYIREHGLQERVDILSGVPFADLPALYQMASLFVYPSCFEGFGIPVLEALVSNTPVVAATGSCLEEAGGEGSLYADPHDAHQLKEHIEAVLTRPSLADAMRRQGQIHARRFAADRLATEMMAVYKSL
jgi:glycosyltransferase involved in cell wall biosynthesis